MIATQAILCSHCSTLQEGPIWLYRWKDRAAAIVAILALAPWVGGFLVFIEPLLFTPKPQLRPILYRCEGSTMSLGIVNTGKAYGFITSLSVERAGPNTALQLVGGDETSELPRASVMAAGQVRSLNLKSVSPVQSHPDQAMCVSSACRILVRLSYEDKDQNLQTVSVSGTCIG